ncbi:hypothetical protein [Mycobacterium sp. 48b]|uniref:hypothetical protein n=1 Tax=Mycobacterium sp. 48b TaxID=3400426 RepID=UPI003AADBEE1
MAVRPLVTTGVVLASAAAIVAATPGLMTPPNIAIAASDAAAVAPKKSVTVNQLNLLALSDIDLQTISDIFFRVDGWGGIVGSSYDPYYGGSFQGGPLKVQTGVDAAGNPVYAQAVDKDGKPLAIPAVDADGNPVVGDTPVYIADKDENGNPTYVVVEDPVFEPADPISGDIYRDGLVGLAYYLSDQVLDEVVQSGVPFISDAASFLYNNVNPYFFEAGIEETFRAVASELTGGISGPVGQALAVAEDLSHNWLTYTGAVLTLVASGVPLAGPDLAAATNIFFFGGPVEDGGKEYNQGIDGIINYVVDRVLGAPAPGSETEPPETETESDVASAKSSTAVLASADKALPALKKLISLDLKGEDAATADSAKLVSALEVKAEEATTEEPAEEAGSGTVTPAVEVSTPAAPKFELPKLPKLNLDLTPKVEEKEAKEAVKDVKEPAAEEKSAEETSGAEKPAESADSGATSKTPNKFAPKSRTTERKKSAGEKFVENATKNLEKAFKPTTKAGADKQETAKGEGAKGDTDSTSGAKAGNAHSDTKDNKGTKDNKDK